jgi:hypothetical protein
MGITAIEFIRIPMFKCLADLTGNTDTDRDNIKLIMCHYNEDIDDNLVSKFHKFKEHFRFVAYKRKVEMP